MYRFEKIKPSNEDWHKIESADDSTCFQTRKWNVFLERLGVNVLIISVRRNDECIGSFIGSRMWLGIPIVMAPAQGYGTYSQGLVTFHYITESERIEIYMALAEWLFSNNIAYALKVDDWYLRRDLKEKIPYSEFHHEVLDKYPITYGVRATLHVSLTPSEEELWARLSYKSCRYCINKATKLGLYIYEVTKYEDIPRFCQVHYDQLKEVCKNKGMRPMPSQDEHNMRTLCESLYPDRVMMLECRGKDENGIEQVMSTGIFCVDKNQCIYWTGASYKRYQKYCPNELMVWEAMKRLHVRGGGDLNFGGMASYKLKFGTIYAYVPRLKFAKYQIFENWSENMKKIFLFLKKLY